MKKKVLYVDDEYPNRLIFELTYEDEFEILLAESADEALDMLGANADISVVITDMRMPGKNGLTLVKEAKIKYPDVVYCLLTGFMITPEIEEALESNELNHYMVKPVEKEKILSIVNG
ncbi:MAG: response regulator [Cyclobacteriaceae bacterium]